MKKIIILIIITTKINFKLMIPPSFKKNKKLMVQNRINKMLKLSSNLTIKVNKIYRF